MFRKKFCFSSQARRVATAIALIDLSFGIVFTCLMSFFLYIFLNYPETLRSMVQENPTKQRDLEKLLAWGPYKQAFCIAIPFTASITNIIMGIFLLIAARKRSVVAVRVWVVLTIIFSIVSLIFFVPEVIFTQEKGLLIVFSLIDYLYNCYSVWIVCALISELKAQSRTSSLTPCLPIDDSDPDPDTELTSRTGTSRYSSNTT